MITVDHYAMESSDGHNGNPKRRAQFRVDGVRFVSELPSDEANTETINTAVRKLEAAQACAVNTPSQAVIAPRTAGP